MIVTFCGHSQTSNQDKISGWLDAILPSLLEGGANTFYLGGLSKATMRLCLEQIKLEGIIMLT